MMEELMSVMLEKRDGVTRALEFDKDKREETRLKDDSLCWTCSNYANCEKVMDERKKTIDQYDFITDGVQFIDERGNSDIFYINGCNSYIKDKSNTKLTSKGKMERERLKNLWYGTQNTIEAERIRREIEARDEAAGRKR